MKRDQQFANIRRIYGPEKEAPGVLAIEVELIAELSTGPTGRTVTPIRTAGGGNPAVLSPLSPLAVRLLLKPRNTPAGTGQPPRHRQANGTNRSGNNRHPPAKPALSQARDTRDVLPQVRDIRPKILQDYRDPNCPGSLVWLVSRW